MRGIHCTIVVLLIACACSAEAEGPAEQPTETPDSGVEGRPPVPLCEGEDEPQPGECQRLVYIPSSGHCNRWFTCSE